MNIVIIKTHIDYKDYAQCTICTKLCKSRGYRVRKNYNSSKDSTPLSIIVGFACSKKMCRNGVVSKYITMKQYKITKVTNWDLAQRKARFPICKICDKKMPNRARRIDVIIKIETPCGIGHQVKDSEGYVCSKECGDMYILQNM